MNNLVLRVNIVMCGVNYSLFFPLAPASAIYRFPARTGTFLNTLDTAQMLVLEIKAFLCFLLTLAWFCETSAFSLARAV